MNKAKLVRDHWSYIRKLLLVHDIGGHDLDRCERAYKKGMSGGLNKAESQEGIYNTLTEKFHYSTAYIHGRKHFKEKAK